MGMAKGLVGIVPKRTHLPPELALRVCLKAHCDHANVRLGGLTCSADVPEKLYTEAGGVAVGAGLRRVGWEG